jgi:hypothetical protein
VETEVTKAKDNNALAVIEMDANAKVGKDVLRGDPHNMTGNEKLILEMLEGQNLTILNSLGICRGCITRERKFENKMERSIIDYIVVCENMLEYVLEISIDDARIETLARYIKTKDAIKIAFRRKSRKIRK